MGKQFKYSGQVGCIDDSGFVAWGGIGCSIGSAGHELRDAILQQTKTSALFLEGVKSLCREDSVYLQSISELVSRHWNESLDAFFSRLQSILPSPEGFKMGKGGHHIWIAKSVPKTDAESSGWHRLCCITERGAK